MLIHRETIKKDVCLFIDNHTHNNIVIVYGTKAKALTGASDAITLTQNTNFRL